MPTVIVVDLQPFFSDSCHEGLLANAAKELKKAVEHGWPVVIVEYFAHGTTHDCLLEVVKDYDKLYKVTKLAESGSNVVIDTCDKHNLPTDHLILFGVNACVCLHYTVHGLAKWYVRSRIDVIKGACNFGFDWKDWCGMVRNINLV